MKFSYLIAVVVLAMGVYYGKLLSDRDLAIAKAPAKGSAGGEDGGPLKPDTTGLEPPPPPRPKGTPAVEPEPVLSSAEESALDEARAAFSAGKFLAAQEAAHQVA